MDIDSIDVGNHFAAVLDRTLESCDALIVLIGPRWLTSRLDDPHDFVRLEIAAVLERQIPIIPLRVGGANMPREDDVPAVLAGLVRRQALTVTDERFHRDVSELIEALGRVGLQKPRPAVANISGNELMLISHDRSSYAKFVARIV